MRHCDRTNTRSFSLTSDGRMKERDVVITTNSSAANSTQQFGKIWPQVVARAWQDAEFREALKRDPMGTIRETYQYAFPTGVMLEIIEEGAQGQAASKDTLRMVIPPPPSMDAQQVALTDVEKGLVNARPFTHNSFTT
jgi:ribosomally synthesized peptide (two-chain TOMM family)